MQEAFLKVNELPPGMPVQQPAAYLFRMALNAAEDHRRRDSRLLTGVEIGELINVADEASDPARIAQGRSEIEVFRRALRGLPERTQQMLLAARVHELPHAEIARRYGVSERIVSRKSSARWTTAAARARAMNRAGSHGLDDDAARKEKRAPGRELRRRPGCCC